MALVKCRECGKKISNEAPTCPHCGVRGYGPQPDSATGAVAAGQVSSPVKPKPKTSGCAPMIGLLFVGAIVIAYMAAPTTTVSPEHAAAMDQSSKESNWIEAGKDAIRLKLKDGESAVFRDVVFSNASGTPVACGEVNSKNSFGAMSGFQKFVATNKAELSYLEEEVSDFEKTWNEFCVRK